MLKVDPVVREALGTGAEHGLLRLPAHPFSYHDVVVLIPGAWGFHVHERYPVLVFERLHHLVDLLGGEVAVGARMRGRGIAEQILYDSNTCS